MIHDFIKMIDNIDFLYGFIYECANLINNLYDYNNYDHLAIKLCSESIMPIINITKKEHIKENNKHIKDIIDNLENIKDIYSICSYLMNICHEEYFKLSQNEYLEIKKFIDNIDNNIDIYNNYNSHYYFSCSLSNIMYPEMKKVESLKETERNNKGFGEMDKIDSIKKFSDEVF